MIMVRGQSKRRYRAGVADREARRLSFGSVAADYDRYRPSPPSQPLDWLIPPGATAVLDLAAGTGAVTRGTPMSPPAERRVTFSLPMTSEQLADLLGTYSG
jgi:hypothetical protein